MKSFHIKFLILIIRKQQGQKHQSYEMVPKLKQATEMASIHPESKTSSFALKPTIEDIHDRSENEENTQSKTSMKNVLYEPGKCLLCSLYNNYVFMHT